MKPVKVLIVDDSALMRRIIHDIMAGDPRFIVVGTARDGVDALEKMERLSPDLVTLDVEMPRMDGLDTLKEIMRRYGTPVIMLSSLTLHGSSVTMEALALGAVDFLPKPQNLGVETSKDLARELLAKAAAAAKIKTVTPSPLRVAVKVPKKSSAHAVAPKVVAIGASTGGPRALEALVTELPHNLSAAVLITQHMPPKFTYALANRLNNIAAIRIKEAENGEPILTGVVYIAPGDYHLTVDGKHCVRLTQDLPVEHVRPSATVMMLSVAEIYHGNTIGVILTGMGKDGADGMMEIKRLGGRTLAQDEESSVIFSMPRASITAGIVDYVLPLSQIAGKISELCGRNSK
ncbi:MAG: chemotaxis response regulator protein-glutamate methylesterase [Clostridiales bacterium]|jgi:two-component system chemotaxis response regulator CheB|nr:chemotaxis response regulator protein-glutamate methylesterase [Clostridiales bacterium]